MSLAGADGSTKLTHSADAIVGGVTASVIGDPAVFVSVAAVHQGPSGGSPVAAIVETEAN